MVASRKNVTISDVAKLAGVSKSAVSYAMNGRRGVSDETRDKVLRAAESLGWHPVAASLLDVRFRSIGVVVQGNGTEQFSSESFSSECLAGLSQVLTPADYTITMAMVMNGAAEASSLHESWIRGNRVDAHLIMGVERGDPRISLFCSHPDIPVLFLSQQAITHGLPTLYSSDEDGMRCLVQYLHGLGHRRIARIAGPERYLHTLVRDRVAADECAHLGMRLDCLHGDFSPESAKMLFSTLIEFPDPPTAIVCDNDVMAVAVVHGATACGISVPGNMSVVSWDDSFLCRICEPSLTALHRDVVGIGRQAGKMLLRMISGESVDSESEPSYELIERCSTGVFVQ